MNQKNTEIQFWVWSIYLMLILDHNDIDPKHCIAWNPLLWFLPNVAVLHDGPRQAETKPGVEKVESQVNDL